MLNYTLLLLLSSSVANLSCPNCVAYSNTLIDLLQQHNISAFMLCGYTKYGNSWRYHAWVGVLDGNDLIEIEATNGQIIRTTKYWKVSKGVIKLHWFYWQQDYRLPRACYFKRKCHVSI